MNRLSPRLIERLIALQFKAIGKPYHGAKSRTGAWYRRYTWTPTQKEEFRRTFFATVGSHMPDQNVHNMLWDWWDVTYGWKDAVDDPQ